MSTIECTAGHYTRIPETFPRDSDRFHKMEKPIYYFHHNKQKVCTKTNLYPRTDIYSKTSKQPINTSTNIFINMHLSFL